MPFRVVILALIVLGPLAGCASDAATSALSSTASPTPATTAARSARRHARRHRRGPVRSAPTGSASGLVTSRGSGQVIQPQPPAGSCHARGRGAYALPDPRCTPGAVNPDVNQATIDRTICVSGWTKTVRPPESITEQEKLASMAAYGDRDPPQAYEYDHLVSLELGGAVNDARNLWPEPGASPNPKDAVEGRLHRLVCDGAMQLAQAQRIIATGWAAWARQNGIAGAAGSAASPPATPTSSRPAGSAGSSPGPNKPISQINCSDFPSHAAAQAWFEAHGGSPGNNVAGLDGNHDGQACTSLP